MPDPGRLWRAVRFWIREFFGENDYQRYVAEWRARHGGGAGGGAHRLLSEREFFAERLAARYGAASARC